MAANDLVAPLAEAPERPSIELSRDARRGRRARPRAGARRRRPQRCRAPPPRWSRQSVALDAIIAPGTRITLTLGRRPSRTVARPLEKLALRARFDLALSLDRAGSGLVMTRQPIAIDDTPLRIQGLVGSSLYRSARAAGAPAKVVEAYIKALATQLSIGRDVAAADSFDLVVERERAATGEMRLGKLLFAGLDQGSTKLQLLRSSRVRRRRRRQRRTAGSTPTARPSAAAFMGMPVAGRITSSFGMRMHPLLGFMRMHKGIDIGAALWRADLCGDRRRRRSGAGARAATAISSSWRMRGGLASGYGHMSRIAVRPGQRVAAAR